MAYTNVTLIQQKTGTTLTADQTSYMEAVILPGITKWIDQYLGLKTSYAAAEGTGTVIFGGNGTNIAILPTLDGITRVSERDQDGTTHDIATDSWIESEPGVVRLYSGRFVKGIANYEAEGPTITVPAPIQMAATIMASNAITTTGSGTIQSEKIGDYQITYASGGAAATTTPDVYDLLAPYRPIRIA